ncbi:hypothetical protein [Streptomyces showdoensis]|uniref:hypothetical protein n=1 Tax=Streptomyces showdoensis TaxID=68268 RepID=UPI001F0B5FB7|nr:hypothetical protein [Streptomyces showdoensis]
MERLRTAHPDETPERLRARIVARGNRAATSEGAFVGGPFMLFIPFAFCAALLSQARMMLELAALEGRDPADPERTAELLVLQGVYEDTDAARAGLAAPHAPPARRPGRLGALWALVLRMARLLGLATPEEGPRTRLLVRIGQWLLVVVVFLVGLVAPLVWLPYMAVSYHRSTARVADRATLFYAGARLPRRSGRLDPAMVVASLRAVLSLLVPLVALTVVALTDARIADRQWPVLGITLFTGSMAVGGWWLWRHHKRRHGEPDP